MNNRRSFISGINSIRLTKKEKIFLNKYKPWGIILFSRNIQSIEQTKKLTDNIRNIFKDKNYPILIDQEGGRVNRLKKFLNADPLTSQYYGQLFLRDKKLFNNYYKIFINKTSYLLKLAGININTVPVLDLRFKGANNIIGDRSFSHNPKIVSKIGDICIKNFHKNNIGTVIKHIPGHGRSKSDSHKFTPTIKTKYDELLKKDFSTFTNKKSFFAMTAHIIYKDIDNLNTTTHSKKVINLIRKKIKFRNILILDDISMKSLKYSIKENTLKAFKSGCNIVLHCNGNYEEMLIVAKNSPLLSMFIQKKTSQFYKILS
jgi:beta-N-acetylhexosaminidase